MILALMLQLIAFLELDSLVKIKINNNYFNKFIKSLYLKGIYKQDYINELYKRYADPSDQIIQVSINPTWDEHGQNEDEDGEQVNDNGRASGENMPLKKRRFEFIKQDAKFAIQIPGIETVADLNEMQKVQQKVQQLCEWEK
jgi:hypothetical protein